jgi:hypothetical protein
MLESPSSQANATMVGYGNIIDIVCISMNNIENNIESNLESFHQRADNFSVVIFLLSISRERKCLILSDNSIEKTNTVPLFCHN